jgi:hypothetical protein
MPEKVTIPISFFEYTAEFSRPILAALMDRAVIVQAIFDALKPWNADIDNIEPITTGKPSEQGVNFKLPEKKVKFFFGAGSCRFTKDDADWAAAEEMITILTSALGALKSTSGAEISLQKTAIVLHLQPRNVTFLEILKPFLSPAIQALDGSALKTGASIVKWERRRIVLDGSAALANAVFLKFEREFDGGADFEKIALQLKEDEDAIFKMLDVEEYL